MDLSKYQELTGISVSAARKPMVNAQLKRATRMLETLLGYPLSLGSPKNLYNELGKSQRECACPSVSSTETLLPADPVVGSYRIFDYDNRDEYFHIDPFTKVHAVKLVYFKHGVATGSPDGVTVKTFSPEQVRSSVTNDGWGKYVQYCQDCLCVCDCRSCVKLAVDADWLNDGTDLPDELAYLLADMVTYHANPKKDLKSESITSHSYTKFDQVSPESDPNNLSLIKRYAGPNGSATVKLVW